jgi:hypothetical protein
MANFIDRVDTKKEILSKLFGICKLISPELIASQIISLLFHQADANLFLFFLTLFIIFLNEIKDQMTKLSLFSKNFRGRLF